MKKGFSLIELMVTIAIIGALTALVLPNISGSRAKSRDAQRISDLSQIQFALTLYYDRCGQYPNGIEIDVNNGCPSGIDMSTFISRIPTPPTGAGQTEYDYAYLTTSGVIVNYVLHARLEGYNVAMSKGLSAMPSAGSGSWSGSYTCSTGSSSPFDYCISAR